MDYLTAMLNNAYTVLAVLIIDSLATSGHTTKSCSRSRGRMISSRTLPLFLLAVLSPLLPTLTSAQSEGDVRLADGPFSNLGRLEIFWQGKWSTFCGLSTGGAQAACRQLGFLDFISYKPLEDVKENLNISEASPSTPIAIDYTKCERSFANGLLHVLRCGYSTQVASDCNHRNDMVLQCQTTPLWTHPYETQVRLGSESGTSLSSGTLEIFLDDKWGNVCGDMFSQKSADSACRQMGYTTASSHKTTLQASTDLIWLNNVACKNAKGSCYCLSGCLDKVPTTPTSCSNRNFVQITCMYDVAIQSEAPSGSRDVCVNRETSCSGPSGPSGGSSNKLSSGGIAGIVVGVLVGVALVLIGVSVCVFFVIPKWKRSQYTSVN